LNQYNKKGQKYKYLSKYCSFPRCIKIQEQNIALVLTVATHYDKFDEW